MRRMNAASNPIDFALDSFKRQGISPLLKKKTVNESGQEVYEDASGRDLILLNEQSRIANIAQYLSDLSPVERNAWALRRRGDGNLLFKERNFSAATQIYFEALAAANFHANVDEGNIDEVVIPLICNLAACSVQLRDWRRTVLLCKEALRIRPNCLKALIRCALAFIELEEYSCAKAYLKKASHIANASDTFVNKKIQLLFVKAERGKLMAERRLKLQRSCIANFFQKSTPSDHEVIQRYVSPMMPYNGSTKEIFFISLTVVFSMGIILVLCGYCFHA